MFNNHLNFLYEKIYLISFFTTFAGTLLPWITLNDTVKTVRVSGIQIIYGIPVVISLILSIIIFIFMRNKNKLVSLVNIICGLTSFIAVVISMLGYRLIVLDPLAGLFIHYGAGIYIALIGSLGIFASGILGLIQQRKE